jgi:hypothetical protein
LPSRVGFYLEGWFYLGSRILKYKACIENPNSHLISTSHLPWEVGFYLTELDFTFGSWILPWKLVLLGELDFKI